MDPLRCRNHLALIRPMRIDQQGIRNYVVESENRIANSLLKIRWKYKVTKVRHLCNGLIIYY